MFRSSSALFAVAFSLSTAQLVCGMYDPQLGRFLTIDPIGYADGVNAYRLLRTKGNRRVRPMRLLLPRTLGLE
ncbi:MAG: hypothetical protein R3C53_19315 [Pirellulaceae bacterium]